MAAYARRGRAQPRSAAGDRVISRRRFVAIANGAILAVPLAVEAQQTRKGYRIGFLSVARISAARNVLDTFRESLRDLGYVEGQNIVIEYRPAVGAAACDRVIE